MKRFWMIAIVVALVAVLGWVGFVSAQGVQPPAVPGRGGMGMGRMMGSSGGHGPMHEYMQAALAEKLGMSETELEQLYAKGQTFWQIAKEKGFSDEQASQMMVDARSVALDKMVADGVIDKEQADQMKNHMGGMMGRGAGYGGCMGGFGTGQGSNGTSTTPRGGMMGRGGSW
jgi:hypothetical protein